MKTNTIIIITIVGIIAIILYMSTCHRSKQDAETIAIEDLQDSLISYRDHNGKLLTLTRVMEVSNAKSILNLITKDSQIMRLQAIIKSHKKGNIENVMIHDIITQYRDTGKITYTGPNYDSVGWTYSVHNDYIKSDIEVKHDTAIYDLTVYNKLSYVHKQVPRGLFGLAGTDHIITATDQNPYSRTTTLKSVVIRERHRPLGIGMQAGYGYYYNNTLSPYIGIGISYNLINF